MGVAVVLAIICRSQMVMGDVPYCRDPIYPELATYCICPEANIYNQSIETIIKNQTTNQDICICGCGLVSILQLQFPVLD